MKRRRAEVFAAYVTMAQCLQALTNSQQDTNERN
jgi:hypothetical protein